MMKCPGELKDSYNEWWKYLLGVISGSHLTYNWWDAVRFVETKIM